MEARASTTKRPRVEGKEEESTPRSILSIPAIKQCSLKKTGNKRFPVCHVFKEEAHVCKTVIGRTGKASCRKVFNQRKVPGLTKKLKAAFYPGYEYHPDMGRGSANGTDLGQKVDRDISKYVVSRIKDRPSVLKRIHPFSKAVVEMLGVLGIKPLKTQVPIYDSSLGIATSLDIFGEMDAESCQDVPPSEECASVDDDAPPQKRKRGSKAKAAPGKVPVVVEIKTGFDEYASAPGGGEKKMSKPLGFLLNSPENQHILQAAVGAEMVRRSALAAGIRCSPRAFVLRAYGRTVQDSGCYVKVYPMPRWVSENRDVIWNVLRYAV